MLSTTEYGDADQAPLVIAHGLFGSGRNWGVIAKRLSDSRRVIAPDLRNHGDSLWTDTHGYDDLASDLAGLADGPADYLGHSMGGKAVMQLALTQPQKVRRLIVADIAPVSYDHSQQAMIDAMRAVDLTHVSARSDADRQLAAHIEDPGIRAFLLQSLDVREKAWRLNLDTLEREMGRITGWPDTAGSFDGEVLFLSGGDSDYVRPEHRDRIRSLFPKARFASLPDTGHWLHAEKPREFEAVVRAFLDA